MTASHLPPPDADGIGHRPARPWVLALKIGASLLFVGVLVRHIRPREIASSFVNIDPLYAFSLLPIAFLAVAISCLKWKLILARYDLHIPLPRLIRLYLVGYFFNNFLPSMVGGDAARAYLLGRRTGDPRSAYVSVLIERLTGLVALSLLVAVLAVSNHAAIAKTEGRLLLLAIAVALLAAQASLFSRRCFRLALRLLPARLARLRTRLDKAHAAFASFRQDPAHIGGILVLSLAFHVLTGINVYCACRALHADPGLINLILVTPLIILVSLLPISVNGIGLWEGSFAVFLGIVGVANPVAVGAALLLRAKTLLFSCIGWGMYIGNADDRSTN